MLKQIFCVKRFGALDNPLIRFVKKIKVAKSPWHGKVWNGNELNKIMKKIHILEKHVGLPEDLLPFTLCFRDLRSLIKAVGTKKLNPNYSSFIQKFCSSYQYLHNHFGVSYTPKFHIIKSHLNYYLDNTKKSLGHYTDQLVEAMHQHLNRIMTRSKYYVKDITSYTQGHQLLEAVHHANSYNLF